MNKWQIICPLSLFAVFVFLAMRSQVQEDIRTEKSVVTQELDGHSSGISALLGAMRTNATVEIEDAAYDELQKPPSSSLIARSDVRVTRRVDGFVECTINTSQWGVPSRTIREAGFTNSMSLDGAPEKQLISHAPLAK